ncbi:MAG: 50S ribosomal protein L17 [Gemmatimonadetes bacterium]|jgi:large subunit ribosomal protein L17|nr:50S ribosomal protein L17 [Gemmatimonadota bacterium]HCK10577.1 50S ribosomal protein L17 [Candidatus Latescibacterota bacterium]
MRHGKRGRKLGRTASHKRATMNNLATSLFMHGIIRTTKPKAKELRGVAERLITFAKRGDLHARRQVLRRIRNKVVVAKLFDEIAPTFVDRQGGYTRVLSLGPRRGDATEVCVIELVGSELRSDFADTVSSGASAAAAAPVEVGEGTTEEAAQENADEAPKVEARAEADEEPEAEEAPESEESDSDDSDAEEASEEKKT